MRYAVGADLSQFAARAFDRVKWLALRRRAAHPDEPIEVLLVSVVVPSNVSSVDTGDENDTPTLVTEERRVIAERHLASLAHELTQAGLPHRTMIVLSPDPVDELLRIVKREKVDVLGVGARGIGAVQRALMGSTSSACVARAKCSVFVTHESRRE